MKLLAKLAELKQHTYTPNSFYTAMIDFLTKVLNGDFIINNTTTAISAAVLADMNAGTESQEITIQLEDTDGEVHDFFNGTLAVAFVSSASGVIGDSEASAITSATFVNGVATFTAYYTGTWINSETVTLTVGTSDTLLGYDLSAVDDVILTVAGA